jgi:16S rRNA processing protein RimM
MDQNNYFKIGYVSKTHGLKGGVTAILDTDFDVTDLNDLYIEVGGAFIPHSIEDLSDRGDKAFLKLEGINSPEAASNLKGATIYLLKSARPKLKRGDFYDDEIIGFEVTDETAGIIGIIKEIIQTGLNKLIVVVNNSGKEILIPINAPFIISVLKSKRKLLVDLPGGYLDI